MDSCSYSVPPRLQSRPMVDICSIFSASVLELSIKPSARTIHMLILLPTPFTPHKLASLLHHCPVSQFSFKSRLSTCPNSLRYHAPIYLSVTYFLYHFPLNILTLVTPFTLHDSRLRAVEIKLYTNVSGRSWGVS